MAWQSSTINPSTTSPAVDITKLTNDLQVLRSVLNGGGDPDVPVGQSSPLGGVLSLASGNLGVGVSLSPWSAAWRVIEIQRPGNAVISNAVNSAGLTSNAYLDGSGWKYGANGTASFLAVGNGSGSLSFFSAASGTSNAAITFSELWRVDASGNALNTGNGAVGYGAGSGGIVTQATSKTTGVTLNRASGQITVNAASLAANTTALFTLTNSVIAANDCVVVNRTSGGTAGAYQCWVDSVAAGSCVIAVRNTTGGALAESPVLQFAVVRGATT